MPTVMITGASAGVGRAITRRFAGPGVTLGLIARGTERLEAAAGEVRARGGRAVVLPADVADPDAVEAAADRLERAAGPIDIWINCAMATIFAPFWEISADEFRRQTEVTYLGCVYGTMAALRRMKPRDHGVIVQISSALAFRSIPLQSAYCGAKHAIVGFTDSIRSELIHERSNVALTAVHLPGVNTPQFEWARSKMPRRAQPVPPIYQPETIADAVHHAAHHPRRDFYLGRSAQGIVLAQKVAPGTLDRYLAETAWSGQMTDEPTEPRPDNLFEPVEGDFAARGRFGGQVTHHTPGVWLSLHRNEVVAAAALGLAALGIAAVMLSGRQR
jgi:short-subunit dehydrogenase